MTAKDQFGVVVRAIGLLVVAYSLDKIVTVAQYSLMYPKAMEPQTAALVGALTLVWIGFDWLLFTHADRVVAFGYKARVSDSDSS